MQESGNDTHDSSDTISNEIKSDTFKFYHIEEHELDTIIEPNTPDSLDLSVHQVFIDTTRSSRFYDDITNWEPHEFDIQGVDFYLNEIESKFGESFVDLNQFPREWIEIHKLGNRYVAHNPLDGIDARYLLTNKSINYYSIESDADVLRKIISLSDNKLIAELNTIVQKSDNQVLYLKIEKTNIPYLYMKQVSSSVDFDIDTFICLVTPLEHLDKFDLVVDHSPIFLPSLVRFDRINIDDYK